MFQLNVVVPTQGFKLNPHMSEPIEGLVKHCTVRVGHSLNEHHCGNPIRKRVPSSRHLAGTFTDTRIFEALAGPRLCPGTMQLILIGEIKGMLALRFCPGNDFEDQFCALAVSKLLLRSQKSTCAVEDYMLGVPLA